MAGLKLYCLDGSPAARTVYLTLAALKLNYEKIIVNLLEKQHLSPEYLEMNPQHTVPTLVDGDFTIWDSHAISAYLVSKYATAAEDQALYPADLQKRAVVDQRLHFDSGVLFNASRSITYPVLFLGQKVIPQEKKDAVFAAYDFLESFLASGPYVAGDTLTIADFACATTISAIEMLVPLSETKYTRIEAWKRLIRELPYYGQACDAGLEMFRTIVEMSLNK